MISAEDVKGLDFFKGMSLEAVEDILKIIDVIENDSGKDIFKEGDKGTSMFIIVDGEVQVLTKKRKEGEHNVAATLQPGDVFGELSLFGDNERSATCRTSGDKKTKILKLELTDFDTLKLNNPKSVIPIYEKLIRIISERFKKVSGKQDRWSFWL